MTLIFNYHIYIFHHSLIKFISKFLFIHFAFFNICVFGMLYLWPRRALTTLVSKIPPDAPLTSILCNHFFILLFNKDLHVRPCPSFCHSNLVTLFLIPSWLFCFSGYTGRQFIYLFFNNCIFSTQVWGTHRAVLSYILLIFYWKVCS